MTIEVDNASDVKVYEVACELQMVGVFSLIKGVYLHICFFIFLQGSRNTTYAIFN